MEGRETSNSGRQVPREPQQTLQGVRRIAAARLPDPLADFRCCEEPGIQDRRRRTDAAIAAPVI